MKYSAPQLPDPKTNIRQWIADELRKLANFLAAPSFSMLILEPRGLEPNPRTEGMIANANGTTWNPGAGAGVYEYKAGAWVKL